MASDVVFTRKKISCEDGGREWNAIQVRREQNAKSWFPFRKKAALYKPGMHRPDDKIRT